MRKLFHLFGLEQHSTPMNHTSIETISKRFQRAKRISSGLQKRQEKNLRFEELENRQLLAVSSLLLDYSVDSSEPPCIKTNLENSADSLIQQTSASLENGIVDSSIAVDFSFPNSATTITVSNIDDSGNGSLRDAIVNASEGSTIVFSTTLQGNTISLASQLTINKTLTIDASALYDSATQTPGITISGQDSCRIFDLSDNASSVTLKGLTLTGGFVDGNNASNPSKGAAVYNGTESVLTIDSCKLDSNNVDGNYGNGGAIYNAGTLTVSNAILNNNAAKGLTGGAGGAIYNASQGNLILSQSILTNNFVKDTTVTTGGSFLEMGGAICNTGTITIACSTLASNRASNGGAICIDSGSLNISNSQIYGNTAVTNGGGLYSKRDVDAVNVTIAGNSASNGGGIYSTHSRAVLNLNNSIVSQNVASSSGSDIKGTVSSGANNLLETFTLFTEAPVFDSKGVLQNAETLNLRPISTSSALDTGNNDVVQGTVDLDGNSRIVNNIVDIGAFENQQVALIVTTINDVVDANDGVLSLREAIALAIDSDKITFDSSLIGKTIILSGKTLTVSKAITIDASSLGQNGITVSGAGKSSVFTVTGGSETAPVNLVNLIMTNGKAQWYGGILVNNGYLTVQNSQFLNGVAYYGGAISNNQTLTLDNCSFTNNKASYGAAIYNRSNGIITINEATANLNVATNHAGFLYSTGPSVNISDSVFTQNTAKNRGGVLYLTKGTNVVNSSNFVDNIGKNYGGIAYLLAGSADFTNCSISGNQASYGGAFVNIGVLTITDSSISNGSSVYGGAVYNRTAGTLILAGATVESNSATTYGGAVYNFGTLEVLDSEFNSNSSLNRAGAIYVMTGIATIEGSTFENNTAKNYGGTIYNAASLSISETSISGGSAIYGGAIVNTKTLTLTDCDLTSNNATKYGGGLYASSTVSLTVNGGVWSGNTANQGGALYVRIGTVRLIGTELKLNSATHSGGAIYNGNQTIMENCLLTENSAKYYGGAINNQKVLRLNGSNVFSNNSTETGKYPDIYTKDGGSVIGTLTSSLVTSQLFDSIFENDEDNYWLE